MSLPLQPSQSAVAEFTLESVASELRRGWLIVGLTGLLFAVALYAISFAIQPAYRANIVMVPAEADGGQSSMARLSGQLGGLAALAGIRPDSASGTKFQDLQYLSSHAFVSAFVLEEKLLPVLFADDWDPIAKRWIDPDEPKSLNDAVKLFNKEVCAVSEVKETGIITLAVTWGDRDVAQKWANLLVDRVNERLRQRAIADANASIAFLNQELNKASVVELRQSIYRLIEGQIRAVMLANVKKQYAFKVIDPAVAPDVDDVVRPRRLVMAVLGGAAGVGLAMIFLFWRARRAALRAQYPR